MHYFDHYERLAVGYHTSKQAVLSDFNQLHSYDDLDDLVHNPPSRIDEPAGLDTYALSRTL